MDNVEKVVFTASTVVPTNADVVAAPSAQPNGQWHFCDSTVANANADQDKAVLHPDLGHTNEEWEWDFSDSTDRPEGASSQRRV